MNHYWSLVRPVVVTHRTSTARSADHYWFISPPLMEAGTSWGVSRVGYVKELADLRGSSCVIQMFALPLHPF